VDASHRLRPRQIGNLFVILGKEIFSVIPVERSKGFSFDQGKTRSTALVKVESAFFLIILRENAGKREPEYRQVSLRLTCLVDSFIQEPSLVMPQCLFSCTREGRKDRGRALLSELFLEPWTREFRSVNLPSVSIGPIWHLNLAANSEVQE
jgi:hypothetical protein